MNMKVKCSLLLDASLRYKAFSNNMDNSHITEFIHYI